MSLTLLRVSGSTSQDALVAMMDLTGTKGGTWSERRCSLSVEGAGSGREMGDLQIISRNVKCRTAGYVRQGSLLKFILHYCLQSTWTRVSTHLVLRRFMDDRGPTHLSRYRASLSCPDVE
jgi:hypothetical protein